MRVAYCGSSSSTNGDGGNGNGDNNNDGVNDGDAGFKTLPYKRNQIKFSYTRKLICA